MGVGMSSGRRRSIGVAGGRGPSSGMLPLLALQVLLEYGRAGASRPPVTAALIAMNALVYLRPGSLDAFLPPLSRVAFNPHLIIQVNAVSHVIFLSFLPQRLLQFPALSLLVFLLLYYRSSYRAPYLACNIRPLYSYQSMLELPSVSPSATCLTSLIASLIMPRGSTTMAYAHARRTEGCLNLVVNLAVLAASSLIWIDLPTFQKLLHGIGKQPRMHQY